MLIGILTVCCAGHANAERIEEIVVTARKEPEPLSNVPLSIYAFDRRALSAEGIDSIQTLMSRTPGMYFESSFGGLFSSPTIRAQPSNATGFSNVGVFIDGVFQANEASMDAEPIDLERVEVIFGPQNTLFGHNTYAGAIQYVGSAPTEAFTSGATAESGSDDYRSASGFLSGPLFDGRLLARAALGFRTFEGTDLNHAVGGNTLGGWDRSSAVLKLAMPPTNDFNLSLNGRLSRIESKQPGVSALSYLRYNCGSVDPVSAAWSYFCDDVPIDRDLDISTGIPESRNDVAQISLVASIGWLGGELTSQTSFYRGDADSYRDFDVSSAGETFGVCTLGANCTGPAGVPRPVNRLISTNEVSRQKPSTEEWSQELRWLGHAGAGLDWMVGGTAYWTKHHERVLLGVARGDLDPSERLAALLPSTPMLLGPLALQSLALVADPNASQVVQAHDIEDDRTLAVFGYLDYQLAARVRARAELRVSRERVRVENRVANFGAGFGDSLPSEEFDDVTPRFSIEYAASDALRGYVSAAKGSQAGGINPIPGLAPSEQTFDPEYNWTYEIGGRYTDIANERSVSITYFYIEQFDTQLLGFTETPGISNLITQNVHGSRVNGVELATDFRWTSWLRSEVQYAYDGSEFNAGTDDPGSRRFCGLRGAIVTSSFCEIGPGRNGDPSIVVPYIDGNQSARVPRTMWHAALVADAPLPSSGGRLSLRIDANGQDDLYERSISGARYGSRTLYDLRFSYDQQNWSVALWGRNLSDENYVREAVSRPAIYFPTTARPLDLIYGDGRRVGLTVTYSSKGSG